MATRSIIVTGEPGKPGAIFQAHELIAAAQASVTAKGLGLEGKVFLVEVDGEVETVIEWNPTTKARAPAAKLPWA